ALAALQRGLDGLPDDATSASPVPASPASAWQGRLLARIAQIHQRRGHHDEALATCQRGLALLPPAGHDDVVGDVYRVLAAIHHDQGNLAQAIAYAETALWASRRAGDVPGQIRSHLALADYYAQRGDYTAGEHIMQARLLQGNTRPAQEMIP
ncbi:MAG: tetratricopeptide repeat protein, partial [Chloroflexi bacterium]|nr:tetratricopeptide repeat protein [Chloroflexota bacterium]